MKVINYGYDSGFEDGRGLGCGFSNGMGSDDGFGFGNGCGNNYQDITAYENPTKSKEIG